jgi:hypothetical protein
MQSFDELVDDIDRELTIAEFIPTGAPLPVAMYLDELIMRHARTLIGPYDTTVDVIPVDEVRGQLRHLMRAIQPDSDPHADEHPPTRHFFNCGHRACDAPY